MAREAEDWIEEISEELDDGNEERALLLVHQGIEEHPDCAELFALRGDALWAVSEVEGAAESYMEAIRLVPDYPEYLAALSRIRFSLCDFFGAHRYAKEALDKSRKAGYQPPPEAYDVLSRLDERAGRIGEADRKAAQANLLDDEAFALPYRIPLAEFEAAVEEAVAELPDRFREAIVGGNVAMLIEPVPPEEVLVEEQPPFDPSILGLYRGVPLPERRADGPAEPDTVHLFHHNLERVAESREELVREIAITVYHELGHFFGLDEDELAELDLD